MTRRNPESCIACWLFDRSGRLAVAGIIAAAIVLGQAPAHAVVVLLRGVDQPVSGYLVSRNDQMIVLDEPSADGKTQRRELAMSSVEEVLVAVDPARLSELRPEEPQGYRNYAEELAEKKADPEARDAAARLFLIAAHLAPAELGRSSLLGMAALARTPAEERKFRAMAYLLDPEHDSRLLSQGGPSAPAAPTPAVSPRGKTPSREAKGGLLDAVRAVRRREHTTAARLLQRPEIAEDLARHRDLMTLADLERANLASCPKCQYGRVQCPECGGSGEKQKQECPACRGKGKVLCTECNGNYIFQSPPPELLQRLLQLELRLSGGSGENPNAAAAGAVPVAPTRGWSEILANGAASATPVLDLFAITRFDPRACVYRNGAWVVPDAAAAP